MSKQNQRHGDKKQTDRDQRGGEGDEGRKKGKGLIKELVQMTRGQGNRARIDCGGAGERQDRGEQQGKIGTTVAEQQFKK